MGIVRDEGAGETRKINTDQHFQLLTSLLLTQHSQCSMPHAQYPIPNTQYKGV
jgi:hypothetical protein